ncbi:hypothetical protein D3C75_510330 [compost metagenome]
MLARHLVIRPGPGRGSGLHYGQIQPGQGACGKARQPLQQGQRHPALGRQLERALTLAQHHTVLQQLPAQHFVVRGAEQVFAADLDPERLPALQGQHEGLLGPFRLEQGGMRCPVREQQAVAAELAIVGKIAEVTAIGPEMAAIVGLLVEPLIHPIPHETALQAGMIAKRLPVVGVAPQAVAHGVGIFAEDQRPGLFRQAYPLGQRPLGHRREGLILMGAGIHGADDVGGRGIGPAPFVLDRAARIGPFDPLVHGVVGRAIAGFVAQGPDDDAGVVEVPRHHAGDPLQEGVAPGGILRQPPHGGHAVGLQVRLVHHVEAEPVTQSIELGMVGVVGAAHRVEVVLLHQPQILLHGGRGHHMAQGGIVFVAIGAANEQRLAVDPQQAALDLHRPKTHVMGLALDGLVLLVQQGQGQSIQMRRLGAPLVGSRDLQPQLGSVCVGTLLVDGAGTEGLTQAGNRLLTEIEVRLHRQPGAFIDLQRHLETGIPVAGVQHRGQPHVQQPALGFVQQADRAEDAAHAPHVLILQIGAIGPAQHQHGQPVRTGLQEVAEIEFGGQPAVLGVTDPAAVAEQMEGAVHPVEDDAGLTAGQPVGGQFKLAGIATGGILCRHPGRIAGEGVLDVGIDGAIKPLQLPVAGHPDGSRAGQIPAQPLLWHQLRGFEEGETPVAIELHAGGRREPGTGIGLAAPAEQGGMGRQTIHRGNRLGLPVLTGHYLPEHSSLSLHERR